MAMPRFEKLPPELKSALLENGLSMQRFYTMSVEQRQHVLDRIHQLNSSGEKKRTPNT